MLRVGILCALLLLAACDEPDPARGAGPGGSAPKTKKPVLATTGQSKIKELHDDLSASIAGFEKELEEGRRPPRWLVRNQLRLVDNLLTATQRAIDEEAKLSVRHRYTALRKDRGQLYARRNDVYEEIRTIQGYLDEEAKGVGGIPPGFTAEEMRDRLGEKREVARGIDEEIERVQQKLKETEGLLAQAKVPPQGVTIFTQEKVALEGLRKRIAAVLDRLPAEDPPPSPPDK